MNSWVIENLGLTLLHSLWQIAFVAVILIAALRVLRESSANFRYFASVSALCLSLILPIATFLYLSGNTSNSAITAVTQTSPNVRIEQSIPNLKTENFQNTSQISPIISENIAMTSPSPKIDFLPILVGVWLIGVLFFSIRLAGGIWTIHLYKTRKVSKVEKHWQEKFDEICKNLQISQKVRFLQSKMVEMPVVIGWLKPVVLVPASAFLQIPAKELETILIHELTHIKRRDYLVNFVQSMVEILFFFHPCIWWISAKIRAEREFAVDEFVSQLFETERFVYAKALANLEESRTTTPILAMAANGGNLMKRIEKILNGSRKINSKNVSIWSAVFAVTFVIGLSVGIYWLKTAETKSVKKQGRKVAVVYDGFINLRLDLTNQEFFNAVEKHKVPTVWVVNQFSISQMKDDSTKLLLRNRYRNNIKFAINAMDSTSRTLISEDSFEGFTQKNLDYLNEVLATEGGKVDYFYFVDGSNVYRSESAQNVEKSLLRQGLKNIPTSAPYYDSLFTLLYERKCIIEKNTYNCEEVRQAVDTIRQKYLNFMTEQFEAMERYSQEVIGREVPQVLYLSSSRLVDESADQIFQMLKDRGYEFVPLEEVMADETYAWQEKIRKIMRFDRNRWDKTSEYLKDEMSIFKNEEDKKFKIEVKPKQPFVIKKSQAEEK
ncbi:MAG: hypothetical protein K1X72_06770 [Pyrinomonadaceae bacterium]|nr:hypothetical protein [Pyrinomonadaceae bacterium]